MLKAASALRHRSTVVPSSISFDWCNHYNNSLRYNSFKAFAQRNEKAANKNTAEPAVSSESSNNDTRVKQERKTVANNGTADYNHRSNRGSFSNISKRNEADRSPSHPRPKSGNNDNSFNNRHQNNSQRRDGNSSSNRPWDKRRQDNNRSNPQRDGRSRTNHGNNNGADNNNANASFASTYKRPLFSEKAMEDLKDISALRNTFMPHRPTATNPSSSATTTNETIVDKFSNDPNSLIGKKFTPSWYTPKRPLNDNSLSASSKKIDANTSLEQVLRQNSHARKQDLVQRYRNAGVSVEESKHHHQQNQQPNNNLNSRFSWRQSQPGRNNEYTRGGQRGGGGGYNPRHGQSNNTRQPQSSNNTNYYGNNDNTRHPNSRNNNFPRGRQGVQHRPPWATKKKSKRLLMKLKSAPKEVKLPTSPLNLADFSRLLRVKKATIVRALRSLGESISYAAAKQDDYTIDTEMMEYICVDLGIEPIKTEARMSSVEEAERRALRQSSLAGELDEEERTEKEELYAAFPPRSPVVSIMGHVDHGKTTLMDALRRRAVFVNSSGGSGGKKEKKKKKNAKSRGGKGVSFDSDNVAGTEAGGITQVITAFEVPLPLNESGDDGSDDSDNAQISTVTFLDTPGHAAFKKMRQSGSSATDVIVLVVAADDGVSPQTIEIIDMFKSIARSQPQSISLVIAVSKIDKHGIDIDEAVMRIENQLIEQEIFTENVLAGGGDEGEFGACQLYPVSGITGEGLDDLVEGLALQSEVMDLRADYDSRGEGIVIDARMEKGLGVVADCVIRSGKVEPGDFVVSGTHGGKVRFLNDVANKPVKKAKPSQPVRIVGFKSIPKAGDPIVIAASEDEAKELIRLRESELHNEDRAEFETDVELQVMGTAAKQGSMMQRAHDKYGYDENDKDGDEIIIPVVIKADSHGALEAVRDALVSIGIDSKLNVVIDPVEMGTGVVTTSDVVMARESDAAIFSFGKVGIADKKTKALAESDGVSIRNHDIIYRLLEDAKDHFSKYLPTADVMVIHGKATVQAVFDVTDSNKKSVSVAGLRVMDGTLFKLKSKADSDKSLSLPCFYRVLRSGEVIVSEDEKLKAISLRKVKEDVDSVRRGDECGLGLDGFNDVKEDDVIECFSIETRTGTL